jgi:hypothetical protein
VLLIFVLAFISCSKDLEVASLKNTKSLNSAIEVRNKGYTIENYSTREVRLINLAKVINYLWNEDRQFKNKLMGRLFNEAGKTQFVFTDEVPLPNTLPENSLSSIGLSSIDYSQILETVSEECTNIVVKVPRWVEAFWLSEEESSISFDYEVMNEMEFVVFPRLLQLPHDSTWIGYKFDENGHEDYVHLHKGDNPKNYLPLIIRYSDTHVFIDPSDFKAKNGTILVNQNYDNVPLSSSCHPRNILNNHVVKDCGQFVLVHYSNFLYELSYKCQEICGNGNDDDFDGLVDESCMLNMSNITSAEICDNGIDDDGDSYVDCDDYDCCNIGTCGPCPENCYNGLDDDGDGLLDEQDPDCCKAFAICLRDCRKESNFIRSAKFKDDSSIPLLSDAPSFDDHVNIRLIFFEFNQGGNVTQNEKQIPGHLFGFCQSTLTEDLCDETPSYFYSLRTYPPPSIGEFVLGELEYDGYIRSVTVDEPMDRINKFEWLEEWDGGTVGDQVRCQAIASNLEVVNTTASQTATASINVTTTIGSQSGGGGTNSQGQNQGSGGWSFNNTQGGNSSLSQTVSYQINTAGEYSLGTDDLFYCDHDYGDLFQHYYMRFCGINLNGWQCHPTLYDGPYGSSNRLSVHGGKELDFGGLTLKTSVEFDWP